MISLKSIVRAFFIWVLFSSAFAGPLKADDRRQEKPASPASSLEQTMARVQSLIPAWAAAGGNQDDLSMLGAQVDWYVKAGQIKEAETVAGRMLDITSNGLRAPKRAPPRMQGATGLRAAAANRPKGAKPGLNGFFDSLDLVMEGGGDVFAFAIDWDLLEPAPHAYDLQGRVVNGLTIVVDPYPQLRGVVVALRMIDTNRRSMPADLANRAFDDPETLSRFGAALDAVAALPSAKRITYLLLGNEVDSYLAGHLQELPAFRTFYQQAVERIHRAMPGVRVGTIFTSGVLARPGIFDALAPLGDFIAYSYYPLVGSGLGDGVFHWSMRPVSDAAADLRALAERAGNKPVAFTEIGYSASPLNASSEEQQAAFIRELFRALVPLREQGRLAFMLYHALYDYPEDFCKPYALQQGIEASEAFCAFVQHVGLRDYATGAPRKAWSAFIDEMKR